MTTQAYLYKHGDVMRLPADASTDQRVAAALLHAVKIYRFRAPVTRHSYAYVRVPFWLVGWFKRNVLPKHPGMYPAEPRMTGPRNYRAQFVLRPKQ
jgi:hypothetical protein